MLAKVLTQDNREYESIIFATFNSGWDQAVIVYDNYTNKLELVRIYEVEPSIIRKVFIIDADASDWVFKDKIKLISNVEYSKCGGYSWIIDDLELLQSIFDKKDIDNKILLKAQKLNQKTKKNEWYTITKEVDVVNLFNAAWGFHDSYIKDIQYNKEETPNSPTTVQILFSGCWGCDIVLELERDVLIHYISNDDSFDIFFDANVLFDDNYIYWVGENIESLNDLKDYHVYFRARSLKWKIIVNKPQF